jgi:hypothetical protein
MKEPEIKKESEIKAVYDHENRSNLPQERAVE